MTDHFPSPIAIRNLILPTPRGYETTDLTMAQGRIMALGKHIPTAATWIDGTGKLGLPGLVNAHTHSPEMWYRGLIPPLPLELWLNILYQLPPLTPEQVYLSALWTAAETLLSGGTTVVDHLILTPGQELETIAAAVRAYRETGIRAFVGPLVQDRPFKEGVPGGTGVSAPGEVMDTKAVLALLQAAVDQFHCPAEGIYIMVAPTGFQQVSDALFEGCCALSERHQLRRHTHLLETKAQSLLAQEKYGGSAVAHLNELGFLGAQTSLAHGVWLQEDDWSILARTQSTVVHNPLSNLRLGSGIAPILAYRQAGVNVAIGCDGACSNDGQDLLEAVKLGALLHNTTTFEYRHWLTPYNAIDMAALGGAKGLAMADQLGTLAVGKQADLVLYDLNQASLLPHTDPLGLLVRGRPSQVVHSAWVSGRQVIAQGQLTTIDLTTLHQALRDQAPALIRPVATVEPALEAQYRAVMGL
ncbi:5-methylthioadenosine/S-adenosylhomocysteine deaminase [Halomicronema hongdechloris C2206]|uniref:5-methylthioadenosine/S-adenosylhomocysteine deaminase n=1 Tax=Halomicronema hongdechloris C2206 TaxID=1641165 RepID=A0A1Z3HQY6_9CYAN|nr:amidohydrolase [Halomicronema hongdechloris]ASC72547.1 5-methylthioadenosine/S-adenosylhomocysteine deaminase [Halomicronema hongdechloris C2206]